MACALELYQGEHETLRGEVEEQFQEVYARFGGVARIGAELAGRVEEVC